MPLEAGTRLGPYEVTAQIGEGGMGEVYRARDTRLDRIVAVKVLPTAFADDAERRARFEREAKAIAALSHPNILAIHDTGAHAGQLFVVTELLDGETLREKLQTGALPVRKAREIGVQIARGLAAAHDKGIVHRDLKPENVFLLRDGQVILDFGLARQVTSPTEATATAGALTDPGTVMANALGTFQIFVHNLTTGETVPLPGTEDGIVSAWSGDGRTLAFIANRVIKRTPASGGPVQTVCAVDSGASLGSWLTWDTADTLAFSTSTTGALWRVAAGGGVPERISEPDARGGELGHLYPRTLGNGGMMVFASTRKDRAGVAVMVRPAGGGPPIHIANSDGLGIPTAKKRLLVVRGRSILALPWDDTGVAAAQGDVLANDLSGAFDSFSGASVGGDTLVYVARNSHVSLGWFDRNGRPLSTVPLEGAIGWPAVAPDDRRVVVDLRNPVTDVTELWLVDGDRRSKIALGPTASATAVWSPDGRRIAYESDVGRELRELTIDTNASRTLRRFDGVSDSVYPLDWSHDGRWIAYASWREGNEDVWLYPTTPGAQPLQLTNTSFHEGSARFSPDSQFVAYRSSEGGRPEVFLRALPPATERIPISTNGGAQPMWRGDGRELYTFVGTTF